MPLGRWPVCSKSAEQEKAEQELAAFLAKEPSWLRKTLQCDTNLTQDEYRAWVESDFWKLDGSYWAKEAEYRKLLQRIPAKWREYRDTLKRAALANVPRGRPGRKEEMELARRIWQLKAEGKNVRQIGAIFKAEGQHFSKEKIEAYLKTRRKK